MPTTDSGDDIKYCIISPETPHITDVYSCWVSLQSTITITLHILQEQNYCITHIKIQLVSEDLEPN